MAVKVHKHDWLYTADGARCLNCDAHITNAHITTNVTTYAANCKSGHHAGLSSVSYIVYGA